MRTSSKMAEARTSKALKMIQLLGNLNNTSVYEYTEEDIKKIEGALNRAVKEMVSNLATGTKVQFSL